MHQHNWPDLWTGFRRSHLILVLLVLFSRIGFETRADAPKAEAPADQHAPIGQFLTISSPVDDTVSGMVRRAAETLQARARQEKRRGILVLEISPGTSEFHHVQGLAKYLATELPSLTTVAWVPETVRGNHVVLALACQEIIMRPDASLGDIGLGKALDLDEQSFIINLVNRRHNAKLSEALVLGMMDPQKEVIWVQIAVGDLPQQVTESRVVLPVEFDRLLKSKTAILKHETIKLPGTVGSFSGERARAYNILAMTTAQSREEVATNYRLPREAMRENRAAGAAPKALVIHVDDVIDPILEQFVQRQIARGVSSGANLLIFEIDSPGGYLSSSTNLAHAIAELDEKKVRTVAYIPKQALSGAAIIALGTDEIYMAPHAQIGDAGPIEIRDGGAFHRAPEKVLSSLRETLQSLAEKKNRPAALAEAMADKDLKVYEVRHRDDGRVWYMTDEEIHESNGDWTKGRAVPEAGNGMLFTVDGRRANVLHLAEAPVADFDDLKKNLGIPLDTIVPTAARTWVDSLVFILNDGVVTTLLFLLGIMCIYLELHFPTGLFGIASGLCFSLFFWSRVLGGTAGWLEVVLFVLGAGCIALEVFVVPGIGVFGISGGFLVLFSLILASQTFIIPATSEDYSVMGRTVGSISGAVMGVVVLAAILGRYLPSIPFLNSMILTPPGAEEATAEGPQLDPAYLGSTGESSTSLLSRDPSLVGREGVATTMLRPAGKAQIGDQFVDVVSEGPFIPVGTNIEVIAVEGNRVVVRQA